jgi:hypothetical protein
MSITYRCLRLKDGVCRRILGRDGRAWLALANQRSLMKIMVSALSISAMAPVPEL